MRLKRVIIVHLLVIVCTFSSISMNKEIHRAALEGNFSKVKRILEKDPKLLESRFIYMNPKIVQGFDLKINRKESGKISVPQKMKENGSWNDLFEIKDLRSDFKQMRDSLEKMHPALYEFTEKQLFDKILNKSFKSLNQSKTLLEFNKIISSVFTRIGCGHSIVVVPRNFRKISPERFFPLDLRFVRNRAYVFGNVHSDGNIPRGAEIISINGESMSDIIRNLTSIISSDGNRIPYKIYQLNTKFVIYYMFYYYFPDKYEIEYLEPGTSKPKSVSLGSVNRGDLTRYGKSKKKEQTSSGDPNMNLEMDLQKDTAVITLKSFGYYGDRNSIFTRFIDDAFLQLKKKGIRNLIVDLRGNNGGDPYCANHLLSHLAKKPIIYFSRKYKGYPDLIKPSVLSKNRFSGNLFIFIDQGGFSTSGHLAALLKFHNIGTLIGAETGATFQCHDNTQMIKLNNTGLELYIATETYTVAVKGMSVSNGVIPDIPIKIKVNDILKKEDSMRIYIRNLIKSKTGRIQ